MPEYAGDKSLDPTPHRRQQARREGHVAKSQDLGSAVLLLAGLGALLMLGGGLVAFLADYCRTPTRRRALADGRRGLCRKSLERHALVAGPATAAALGAALPGRRRRQRAANRLSLPARAAGLRFYAARSRARLATQLFRGQRGPPEFRTGQAGDCRGRGWRRLVWPAGGHCGSGRIWRRRRWPCK